MIGGYVVRDPSLPAFAGRYLFGRLNSGIYRLEANGSATHLLDVPGVSGFGEDGTGHLYVTSLNGAVYRLGQNGSNLTTTSIGSFTQPLGVAAAPGDTERLFVVEKTGKVKVRTGGQVSDFLDVSSLIDERGRRAGPARVRRRARLRDQRARVRLLHEQGQRPPARRVQAHGRRSRPRRPLHAPPDPHHPARPGPEPQRRAAAVRARRAALPVDRRRGHPGRPGGRRSEPRVAARQGAAPRRRRQRGRRRHGRAAAAHEGQARASACCACAARSSTPAAARAAR